MPNNLRSARLVLMKKVVFFICAIAIFVAGFTSVTHADATLAGCSHHTAQKASIDKAQDVQCPDAQDQLSHNTHDHSDQSECQDCCCLHTHVMTGSFADLPSFLKFKKAPDILPEISLHSQDSAPLYRPPIA